MFVVVMGLPSLHNRHFPKLHAVKLTPGAVPCVTASIDDKAKRTAAQVAALGQCDQVAAGLGVGHIQCERQPGFILAQRELTGLCATKHASRIVVSHCDDVAVTGERCSECTALRSEESRVGEGCVRSCQ